MRLKAQGLQPDGFLHNIHMAQLQAPYPAGGVVMVSGSEGGLVPDGVVATAVME